MSAPNASSVSDPYTLERRLCDVDGIVSERQVEEANAAPGLTYLGQLNNLRAHTCLPPAPAPFMCTGSAHLAREHIRCTSPAHSLLLGRASAVNFKTDAYVAVAEAVRRADAAEARADAAECQRDEAWEQRRTADVAAERARAELSRVRAATRSLCANFIPTSGGGRARAFVTDIRAVLDAGGRP